MLKKFLASVTALALALGIVALVSGPASAHTGDLNVSVACQADGTYKLTATLTIAKTGETGKTYWKSGTSSFEGTPKSTTPQFANGPVASTGSGTITLGTVTLPGTTTGLGPWFYAETTFSPDNYFVGSDGQLMKAQSLDGSCSDTPDSTKITFCHQDGKSGNYSQLTTSTNAFYISGHISHTGDIYPAGSIVKKGVTYSWPAQGNQSLLAYPDCAVPIVANARIGVSPLTAGCDATTIYSEAQFTIEHATWTDAIDNTPGTHQRHAKADQYSTFSDGSTVSFVSYTVSAGPTSQSSNASAPCFVPPAAVPCQASPGWATEDVAPLQGQFGLIFAGPSVSAIDTYQRVSAGNMQGLTGMTYTVTAGETGQPAQLVVEVNPNTVLNSGGPVVHYATVSTNFPAGSSGVLNAQSALWSTTKIAYGNPGSLSDPLSWSALALLMPQNTLLSAPSLHLLTNSTSGDRSVVSAVSSSCGSTSFVPEVPRPIRYTTQIAGVTACSPAGGGSYDVVTHYWEQDAVWSDTTHTYSNPTDSPAYEWQEPTTVAVTVTTDVCPTQVTPLAPDVTAQSCQLTEGGSGVYTDGYITIPSTTGVTYSIDGDLANVGPNVRGPGLHTVTAVAASGYTLTGYPNGGWTRTITAANKCGQVTPIKPTVTDQTCAVSEGGSGQFFSGSLDIPSTTGVIYFVDGVQVVSGEYSVTPGGHLVTADATDNYTLVGYPEGGWTLSVNPAVACGDVTPIDPTVVDQTCLVGEGGSGTYLGGYIDLPVTTLVDYFIDGEPAATHNMLAPGSYRVTAQPTADYTLTGYPEGGWTKVIHSALACGDLVSHPIVTPSVAFTQLGCTAAGSYTLSNDLGAADGVNWTVDGASVAAGTYQVTNARTVTVHAEPNGPAFGFAFGQQQDWSFTYAVPATCQLTTLALGTLAQTGVVPVGGMVLGYFLLIAGLGLLTVRWVRRRPVDGPKE